METFVKFYFWWHVVDIAICATAMCFVKYPRTPKYTIGNDMLKLMTLIGFAIWAGFLLYA